MKLLAGLLVVAGCAANVQTVQLVNRTPRAIEQIYIYPLGAANHGAPRTALAPNATAQVKVTAGNIEVLAVSAKIKIDDRTRETPTATQAFELKAPLEVIFYDAGTKPPEVDRPGVIGVRFTTPKPAPSEPTEP